MANAKSRWSTILLLGITFFAPTLVRAQLTFTTNNGAITITGCTGSPTVLDIPASTNGYQITSIGNNAFSGKSSLAVVTMANGITNIGSYAFQSCYALSAITIPDSVTTLGVNAFNTCNNATNLVIGNGVTRINSGTFQTCSKLGTVLIPDAVTNIGASAFAACNLLTNLLLGSNVAIIGATAFQNCGKLRTFTIPTSVTNIGASAFSGCSALTGAFFNGNAPTNASATIFSGDNSATVFYLTNTVGWGTTFGGVPAMLWNPQLQCGYTTNGGVVKIARYTGTNSSVAIPGTLNGLPVTSIENSAFKNDTQLVHITLPGSVTNIGSSAFAGSGLTSFIASNTLVTIGGSAFQSCLSLTNVAIGRSVTNLGGSAFYDCHLLTAITVDALNPNYCSLGGVLFDQAQTTLIQCPGGVTGGCIIPATATNLVSTALTDNPGLSAINVDPLNPAYSSIDGVLLDKSQTTLLQYPQGKPGTYTVPGNVTDIDYNAFASSVGLTSVMVGDSVRNLGDQAFAGCANLTNAVIGNQVARIGYFAFNFCPHLATISLGTNISSIKAGAFQGCGSLTGIVLPFGVFDIGPYAFNQCSSLTNIVIPNTVTSIGDYAFISCGALTSITLPDSLTSLGTDVFGGCVSMISATVGKGVASLPDWTFQSCRSLTGIYFRGDAPSFGAHVFDFSSTPPVYYLPGTVGWSSTFDGLPVVLWNPQGTGFGRQAGQFGFNITGSSNLVIVVEAGTNPAAAIWSPVSTNILNTFVGTNGTSYFSDSQWSNYPTRFYRFRAP